MVELVHYLVYSKWWPSLQPRYLRDGYHRLWSEMSPSSDWLIGHNTESWLDETLFKMVTVLDLNSISPLIVQFYNLLLYIYNSRNETSLTNLYLYYKWIFIFYNCQAQGHLSRQTSNLRDDPEIGSVMGWSTTTRQFFLSCKLLIKVKVSLMAKWAFCERQVNVRWSSGEV